ncbi:MAG TPA: hypothetical protein VNJ04_08205 [Gemmatimonadaceae bacterium]|nr:hypothetical protein [Gemmatimonadaceae bacterium]
MSIPYKNGLNASREPIDRTPLPERPDATGRLPAGFREASGGSGLLVPEALSRTVETWTEDERTALQRAANVFARRGVRLVLLCGDDRCAAHRTIAFKETSEGEITLRCGHAERRLPAPRRLERASSRQARRNQGRLKQKRADGVKLRIEQG